MGEMVKGLSFYEGKRVLVTGHTGFKGAWLCRMLNIAGAEVFGYALAPADSPNLYTLCPPGAHVNSTIGDVRDYGALLECMNCTKPEIVLHLAAQPVVRESYKDPLYTYETNVMGTVHILEAARQSKSVRSLLNVTTDKVYLNREWERGYREDDYLDGYDPYSNSKSCSELITNSYRRSFFSGDSAVSTARAGNVIGGGDFAVDRIVPDCVRAASAGRVITVRNPHSVRPYQHVLEPLAMYLEIAEKQLGNPALAGAYNIGPEDCDCISTGNLVDLFCQAWGGGQSWENKSDGGPHEADLLKLDCSMVRSVFGWQPVWHIGDAVQKTVEWSKAYLAGEDILACMDRQIREYFDNRVQKHEGSGCH